jgi:hypothetical protein
VGIAGNEAYLMVAVGAGIALLVAVITNYLRGTGSQGGLTTTLLSIGGVVLVSSPLWSSIVVEGGGMKMEFLRECTEKAEKAVEALEAVQPNLPPDKAADYSAAIAEARRSLTQLQRGNALPPQAQARELEAVGRAFDRARTVAER